MNPKEALDIAKAATSDAQPATDAADPRGLKSGDEVTVPQTIMAATLSPARSYSSNRHDRD
ncbi:MAG: hypothetical protein WDM89_11470 [Rhizomicrobium sp.]